MDLLSSDFKDLVISQSPQDTKNVSIRRCIRSLIHACQCRDPICRLSSCQRMKRIVRHTKVCKLKVNGNCAVCKQLIALCFYHAKYCKDTKCDLPICSSIKQKMKQPQLQQRLQQAQLLRRRMAAMNSRISSSTGSGAPSNSGALSPGSSVQNSSSSSSSTPSSSHRQQPGRLQPPARFSQVLKQVRALSNNVIQVLPTLSNSPNLVPHPCTVQRLLQTFRLPSSPQQQDQISLKTNPQLMVAFIKQKLQQQQQQQQQPDGLPGTPESLLQQQQTVGHVSTGDGLINQNMVAPQQVPVDVDMQVLRTPHISSNKVPPHRAAIQQLWEMLRLPSSPQQHDKILELLNANPRLMAAFIKHRLQRQQQQQQQLQQEQPNGPLGPPESLSQQQQTVGDGSTGDSWMNQDAVATQQACVDVDMQVLPTQGSGPNEMPQYCQALQQLLELLRLPSSPQQQDQILEILKTNPQLIEAFSKLKQPLEQLQQLQWQGQLPQQQQSQQQQMVDQPELKDLLNDEWIDSLESYLGSSVH